MKRTTVKKIVKWIGSSVAVITIVLVSLSTRAEENKAQGVDCVTWNADAPFVGLAYNHLVHLKNNCDHNVNCNIKTDVNPKEETVSVPAGGQKTQLTFRGSPAREFKATVTCIQK